MIPQAVQDMLDGIELDDPEPDEDNPDPEWLAAIWPIIIAKLGKSFVEANWKLWVKAWKDSIHGAFEFGEMPASGGVATDYAIQYFMDHGMELVRTLSQTDIQILKDQMVANWGKGEDAFRKGFQDAYNPEARLDKIYRTEYVKAQNQGIIARAHNAGHQLKMWRCPNDERSCPECSALDFEIVGIDEDFSAGVDSPGLHPFCRCVLITLADEDSEVPIEDVEPIAVEA